MAYGLSHRRALKSVAFEADFKRKSVAKATYLGCPCDPEHKPKLAVGLLDAVESAVATAETCSQQQQQQRSQKSSGHWAGVVGTCCSWRHWLRCPHRALGLGCRSRSCDPHVATHQPSLPLQRQLRSWPWLRHRLQLRCHGTRARSKTRHDVFCHQPGHEFS